LTEHFGSHYHSPRKTQGRGSPSHKIREDGRQHYIEGSPPSVDPVYPAHLEKPMIHRQNTFGHIGGNDGKPHEKGHEYGNGLRGEPDKSQKNDGQHRGRLDTGEEGAKELSENIRFPCQNTYKKAASQGKEKTRNPPDQGGTDGLVETSRVKQLPSFLKGILRRRKDNRTIHPLGTQFP
jgi:hypothetical protein